MSKKNEEVTPEDFNYAVKEIAEVLNDNRPYTAETKKASSVISRWAAQERKRASQEKKKLMIAERLLKYELKNNK